MSLVESFWIVVVLVITVGTQTVSCSTKQEQSINYRVDVRDEVHTTTDEYKQPNDGYRLMKLQNGTLYRCKIENENEKGKKKETTDAVLHAAGVAVITKRLNEKCIILVEGWWTYEYCHQKHVTQFHMDPKGNVHPKHFLGKGSSDLTLHRDGLNIFYSSNFTSGDICDITGLPRTTIINYRCPNLGSEPQASKELGMSLKEIRTCSYLVVVDVDDLCPVTHPNSEKDVSVIPCYQMNV